MVCQSTQVAYVEKKSRKAPQVTSTADFRMNCWATDQASRRLLYSPSKNYCFRAQSFVLLLRPSLASSIVSSYSNGGHSLSAPSKSLLSCFLICLFICWVLEGIFCDCLNHLNEHCTARTEKVKKELPAVNKALLHFKQCDKEKFSDKLSEQDRQARQKTA